jgi:ATP synthase protein I
MTDASSQPALTDLGQRLSEARGREAAADAATSPAKASASGLGMAFRVGIELVSALAVGVGLGLLLDHWLGTRPWLLVVFFFLGAAAGILNVYRAASRLGMGVGYRRPSAESCPNPG